MFLIPFYAQGPVRDFKFLLFFIPFNCEKFQQDWTTLILDILQGPPFEFLVDYKIKKPQNKMSHINVVQSC